MKKERVHLLVESAMLMTLGIVLEIMSKMFIPELPFGGQLTLASMLPLVLISYRHGVRWGFFCGSVYALLQMALGTKTLIAAFQPGYFEGGNIIFKAILMIFLDYVLAYTVLGLGGIFKDKIKRSSISLMLGSVVALFSRYIVHIISGYILFGSWAEWFFTQEGFPAWGTKLTEVLSPSALGLIYSIVYNGMYMLPEIVITAIASFFIAKGLKKYI